MILSLWSVRIAGIRLHVEQFMNYHLNSELDLIPLCKCGHIKEDHVKDGLYCETECCWNFDFDINLCDCEQYRPSKQMSFFGIEL